MQPNLFGDETPATPTRLEVHEHSYVSGPRANGGCYGDSKWLPSNFKHSHEGGNVPHQHPNTGPACYTIDKDEWARATGMQGGGRKKFTSEPTGEQLPWKDLDEGQGHFQIILGPPTPESWGTGPGVALPARMVLSFGMTFDVVEPDAPIAPESDPKNDAPIVPTKGNS